jgi:hypothetical protein
VDLLSYKVINIVFASVLEVTCGEVKLVPKGKWAKEDLVQMEIAKDGCKKFYGQESCLIEFRKVGPYDYEAICKDI